MGDVPFSYHAVRAMQCRGHVPTVNGFAVERTI